jgi:glycosyltransferase involved in cell wall biosynthesis
MDLSVIIPAFNEQERIAPTLRDLAAFLAPRGVSFELLVVDDGSTDDTAAVVESLRFEIAELRCVRSAPNRGKGHAVRVGMLEAAGAFRVMIDADGSIPATELPALLEPILDGDAQLALGSRYLASSRADIAQPVWRRAWSRLANWIVARTVVSGIRDTQCGFKAFTAEAAGHIFSRARIDGWAFDLEVLALARGLGYEITEVGVFWRDDERSRVSPMRDLVAVIREWVALRRNLRLGAYGPLRLRAAPESA